MNNIKVLDVPSDGDEDRGALCEKQSQRSISEDQKVLLSQAEFEND